MTEKIWEEFKSRTEQNSNMWYNMLAEYCNDRRAGFIRDFATKGFRVLISSVHELYAKMMRHNYEERRDAFISIYEYNAINRDNGLPDYDTVRMLDKVVFDIDSDDLEDAWDMAKMIKDTIEEVQNLDRPFTKSTIDIFFTGGRGFHVYYIPWNPFLSNYEKSKFCKEVYDELGQPDIIDTSLFMDTARDIRIPYTIHPKTERQMQKVNKDECVNDIIAMSENVKVPPDRLFG